MHAAYSSRWWDMATIGFRSPSMGNDYPEIGFILL